jgi:hypothetical protein
MRGREDKIGDGNPVVGFVAQSAKSDIEFSRVTLKFQKRDELVGGDNSPSLFILAVGVRCVEHATGSINLRRTAPRRRTR